MYGKGSNQAQRVVEINELILIIPIRFRFYDVKFTLSSRFYDKIVHNFMEEKNMIISLQVYRVACT